MLEVEFIHIAPRSGSHNETGRASDCRCEPTVRVVPGIPWLRVAVHQGITKARMEAEIRRVTTAYLGEDNA